MFPLQSALQTQRQEDRRSLPTPHTTLYTLYINIFSLFLFTRIIPSHPLRPLFKGGFKEIDKVATSVLKSSFIPRLFDVTATATTEG